jgi:hypothetical protein
MADELLHLRFVAEGVVDIAAPPHLKCPSCKGTGTMWFTEGAYRCSHWCRQCEGTGKLPDTETALRQRITQLEAELAEARQGAKT